MSRPNLAVIDDPLGPGPDRQPAVTRPERAQKRPVAPSRVPGHAPAPAVEAERLEGVYGRVPASLARRLEGVVFDLKPAYPKLSRQELLAALLSEHVDRDAESLAALGLLVERYRSTSALS